MKSPFILLFLVGNLSMLMAQDIQLKSVYRAPHASGLLSPAVHDSVLYFAQNIRTTFWKSNFDTNGNPFYKIYRIPLRNRQPVGKPTPLFTNTPMPYHRSGIAFHPITGQAAITQSSYDNSRRIRQLNKKNTLSIVQIEPTGTSGKRAKSIEIETRRNTNIAYPAFSPDGNTLVFVSDMPESIGNTDLFVCRKTELGWSTPENMGAPINTSGTETAPFFHPSGKLYFASNGRADGTRMDLYYTYPLNPGYAPPVKLDDRYNSEGNDYGFFLSADESWGYLLSDRSGVDELFYFEETFPAFDSTQVYSPENYCFTFFESSTEQYDPQLFTFKWTFSDGHSSWGVETDHCLPGPGNYQVNLDVYDQTSSEQLFTVSSFELNLERTRQVNFLLPENIRAGELVTLTASVEAIPDLNPKEYYWTIGPNAFKKGKSIQYRFPRSGVYTLKCGTIDTQNSANRVQTAIQITVTE